MKLEEKNPTGPLDRFVGKTATFSLPSGRRVTIREQNGEDDDVLSSIGGGKDDSISNINNFLAGLVVKDHETDRNFLTPEGLKEFKLADKYALLLKSRIHSLGTEMKFEFTCTNKRCGHKMVATEDLAELDYDFDNEDSEKDRSPNPFRLFPHKHGKDKEIEFELTTGKKLKYEFMTVNSEFGAVERLKRGENISRNTEFLIRNISFYDKDSGWIRLGSFSSFSFNEMGEIRKHIMEHDLQPTLISEVECPKCGNIEQIPINNTSAFFYPMEI